MKTPRILATSIAATAALVCLAPFTLHAADRFWIDSLGGSFSDIANWSTTAGGVGGASVPVAADIANFTLNNTYTVTLGAAAANTAVDVENGNVTLDLGGFTYSLTSGGAVFAGNVSGQTGRLTVRDGILAVDTNGDNVTMGVIAGSTGFLTVTTGGRIGDGTIRPDLLVGEAGTGTLTVNDNGRIDGAIFAVGNGSGVTGTATITGPNAVANFSGSTIVGSAGTGSVTMTNGGTLTSTGAVTLGSSLGADGTVVVSGIGSSWAMGSTAAIGSAGDGTLNVTSGGLVSSTGAVTLGSAATGFGTATVTGAGSRWNLLSTVSIGSSGLGVMTVSNGGQVVSTIGTTTLGLAPGSEGRVTVTGTGSKWTRLGGPLVVGGNGAGDLMVSAGGEVSTTSVVLGSNGASSGVTTVSGIGSRLMTSGNITVASDGNGTLNVTSGAAIHVGASLTVIDPAGGALGTLNLDGGSIFVTGDFTNNSVFNFNDGLLQVAGNFQPNATAVPLTIDGSDNGDLPTLELLGSGTTTNVTVLQVGDEHRGQLLLRQGRVLNVGASTIGIGIDAGSEGFVSVNSGAQLVTTTLFGVGGSGTAVGGKGTLDISGGTVTTSTMRLFRDGTINLLSGTLAVNGFAELDGQFNWTGGTLRFGGATTLNSSNVPTLLGLDGTLNSGQTLASLVGFPVTVSTPVIVDGGTLSFGDALINNSTLEIRSGSASVAGTLTNAAGARLFVARDLSVGTALNNAVGARLELTGGTGRLLGGGTIANTGLVTGDGTITNTFNNNAGGEVRGEFGKTLTFTGTNGANAGRLNLLGGTLQFTQQFTNSATGQINGQGALYFPTSPVPSLGSPTAGLMNSGNINLSGGDSQIYGTVQMLAGSRLIVSGGATASFFDIFRHSGLDVKASAGSAIVFFGEVRGAGSFSGTGTIYFESGYSPGNSPALVTFGGDVVYGTFLENEMELGGTVRGTGYDAMNVAGKLTFGGTLNVLLISGFQPAAGNVFNLYDFGTTAGTFSTVNLPALNPGLLWSQANLYTAGEIQVALDPVFISRTWDGGGTNNNWITDNNWTLDVQPLNNATADLIFTGNVRLAPSVDTPWNVHSITFNNAAGAFTITGPQGVTIGSGGIVNNDTETQTIAAAITLSANESFNAAAGDLAISSVALAGQTLALTGANDITLATASGSGTINKNNAGDLDITGALGTSGVILNANAGETNIGVSETLAALTIANGATVTLGAITPAPEFAPVPEPGTGALLLSALSLLSARRRGCGAASR